MKLDGELAKQLAGSLKNDASEVAFLEFENAIFFAREKSMRPSATSAVVRLIEGVYAYRPEMARAILRRRIYFTGIPSEMCLGMLKVAAKRMTTQIEPIQTPPNLLTELNLKFIEPPHTRVPPKIVSAKVSGNAEELMREAVRISREIPRDEAERFKMNRPVAAILATAEGEILSCAANSNATDRTRHAEVNLVQEFCFRTGGPLPPGAQLFATLKPCRMCAGMIWNAAQNPSELRVYYAEEDLGPNARDTALDRASPEIQRHLPITS